MLSRKHNLIYHPNTRIFYLSLRVTEKNPKFYIMKKCTYIAVLLFLGLFCITSCENEPLEGEFFSTPDGSNPQDFCDDAPAAIAAAQLAFLTASEEELEELCNSLTASINATISVCGDPGGVLQEIIDDLEDCTMDTGGDDDPVDDNLVGRTYLLTAFQIESEIDLNNDGNFTNDFIVETGCYQNETIFFDDETSLTVFSTSFLELFVDVDINGNVTQEATCVMEEETSMSSYVVDGNVITIDGIEGIISNTQIIFTVPDGYFGELISDDGTGSFEILEDVTFTYTLQ